MTIKVNSAFGVDMLTQMLPYSTGVSPRLEIYSGVMPDVDDAFVYAPANYAAQRLGQTALNAFSLQMLNGVMRFNQIPAAFAATAGGTATWFAMYHNSSNSRAILGTITDSADGTGVLILDTVTIINGQNINVLDVGIRLG